jgi:hypothetical protein
MEFLILLSKQDQKAGKWPSLTRAFAIPLEVNKLSAESCSGTEDVLTCVGRSINRLLAPSTLTLPSHGGKSTVEQSETLSGAVKSNGAHWIGNTGEPSSKPSLIALSWRAQG